MSRHVSEKAIRQWTYSKTTEDNKTGGGGEEAEDQHSSLEKDINPLVDRQNSAGRVLVEVLREEAVKAGVLQETTLFGFLLVVFFGMLIRR